MPKMKTHSGAKKRLRVNAGGKIKKWSSKLNHIMAKMSPKVKRRLGQPSMVAKPDVARMKNLLAS